MQQEESGPRVTHILAEAGILEKEVYAGFEVARERGTAIHLATHYDDIGDLDELTLDPVIQPYLEGWRAFRRDHICVWTHIEERLFHSTLHYYGSPDRVGMVDGWPAIVDIKSGSKARWHPIQLAGYANLLKDPMSYTRIVVRLPGDGTYKLDPYGRTTANDLNVFLSAINIYHWKLTGGNHD